MVTFGLVAAIGLYLLVDSAVRGRWDIVGMSFGWVALAVWLVWAIQVRPCIRVEPAALSIVNVLRVTRIPWPDVEEVTMRYQIAIETHSGRRVRAWGGPALPRPKVSRDGTPDRPGEREIDVILDADQRWHDVPSDETLTRSWDRPALLTGALCAAAALASLMLALLA
jgi:hypothetical protein